MHIDYYTSADAAQGTFFFPYPACLLWGGQLRRVVGLARQAGERVSILTRPCGRALHYL